MKSSQNEIHYTVDGNGANGIIILPLSPVCPLPPAKSTCGCTFSSRSLVPVRPTLYFTPTTAVATPTPTMNTPLTTQNPIHHFESTSLVSRTTSLVPTEEAHVHEAPFVE